MAPNSKLGPNFGTRCTVAVLTFQVIFMLLCLCFTLAARLYLKAYFCAAHMAALSVFITLFVFSHHCFRIRGALGLSRNAFRNYQTFVNAILLLCCVTMAVCYTIMFAKSANISFDYLGAFVWSWVDSVIMLYLLMVGTQLDDKPEEYRAGFPNDNLHRNDIELNGIAGSNGHWMVPPPIDEKPQRRGCFVWCLVIIARIFFWIFHLITILLFVVFFLLSSYHAAASVRDVMLYRDDRNLITVEVPNHRPLALYMQCAGSGKETILYENGLGDSLYLTWSFIPQHLMLKYKICVYDRRGYGWSESYENDYPGMLKKEPQWSKTNVEFTKALVDAANLTKPFFYAGHSYGGHHLLYLTLKYPNYIKGLIFLDASRFSTLDLMESMLEVLVNFQHTGVLRFAIDTGLFNFDEAFSAYIPFEEVREKEKTDFISSSMTGDYFLGFSREKSIIDLPANDAFIRALDDSEGVKIYKPVLVIDAGDRSDWFPSSKFAFYEERFHIRIAGSEHSTLTHSNQYSRQISEAMDLFIQHVDTNWDR